MTEPGLPRTLPHETTVPSARDSTVPPAPGERLGDYEVRGTLGAGGMGEVLLVRDAALGRDVAAKVIRGEEEAGELERRFVLEARITGQLAHPNIVPVHQLSRAVDGRQFFTMHRVEGRTLTQALGGAESLVEQLGWFLKICDALRFAHSRGVIHRDLKPDNIMVGAFGEVLVMDWGLAKQLGSDDLVASQVVPSRQQERPSEGDLQTLDGQIIGTPNYMPPEQALGELEQIDARSDIYSLGAILYQLLTGAPPFEGENAWAVIASVVEDRLVAPRERAPDIPWELEAVVLKAMAREREARYPSVDDLRADVAGWLEGRPLDAARYRPWQLLAKWAWRRRAALLPLAALVLAGLVVGGWGVVRVEQERRKALAERDGAVEARRETARAARDVVKARDAAVRARGEAEAARDEAEAARDRVQLAARLLTYERLIAETRSAFYGKMLSVHVQLRHLRIGLEKLEAGLGEIDEADRAKVEAVLGVGWYYCGQERRAEHYLLRAHAAMPTDGRVTYHLGKLYGDRSLMALSFGETVMERLHAGAQWAMKSRGYLTKDLPGLSPVDRLQAKMMLSMALGDASRTRELAVDGGKRYWGHLGAEGFTIGYGYAELQRDELMRLVLLLNANQRAEAAPLLGRLTASVIDGCSRALTIRPHYPQARVSRAGAHVMRGELKPALADYGEALSLYPRMPWALLARARVRRAMGDGAGAAEDVAALLRYHPNAWYAYAERARLRVSRDRPGAIVDLGKAIELAPEARKAGLRKRLETVRRGG